MKYENDVFVWEQMKDRYGCTTVDEMLQSKDFIVDFEKWAQAMDKVIERDELEF